MSTLEVFQYVDRDVRMVTVDGEVWFVLADICAVLEISNSGNVAARLDEADIRQTEISSGGQRRAVSIVSESGMYEVVIRSDKPEARRFRWWVTHEVIPAIRRTGSYAVESPDQLMARAVIQAQELIARKDEQIAVLAPRAEAWDELASADGDYEVGDAAKILARAGVGTGRQRLFAQLAELGWIYRGAQGKWKARQSAVDSGWLTEKPQSHHHPRSGEVVLDPPQVRVTVRGLERLRIRLGTLTLVAV